MTICPATDAYTATSYTDASQTALILPGCGKWTCQACSPRRVRRLVARILAAEPERFLTLTVRPNLLETPRACYDRTRRKVSELFRWFRKQGKPNEYCRILETTKRGYPHYHFLLRGSYWPQNEIRLQWERLTGSYVVDIRRLDDITNAASYVAKYLTKGFKRKASFTRQFVSSSKGFFRPEDKPVNWLEVRWERDPAETVVEHLGKHYSFTPRTHISWWLDRPGLETPHELVEWLGKNPCDPPEPFDGDAFDLI